MESRVVAKLKRMELSEQLGKLLRGMPVRVTETTKTDCVYLGTGTVDGVERRDVTVSVSLTGGQLKACVLVDDMEVASAPFTTEEEQSGFREMAKKAILARMN